MKILALDFGEKRIGVATGDTDTGIAFPQDPLAVNDQLMKEIETLCEQNHVHKIIVGLPLMPKGFETKVSNLVRDFVDQLEDYLLSCSKQIPVDLFDERFSTFTARSAARAMGLNNKQMQGNLDSSAAAVFLQHYFDSVG
jgi:putative Holliday junction resolvase